MSHTPGPWEYVAPRSIQATDEEDGSEVTLATLPDWMGQHQEELVANGRLIAASPDLLAALERIVALYDERWAASIGEIDDARAAIAKAKGE